MLSRASSDAGTRLRRSKSTSTVHSHRTSVPEPLDPELARKQALAAATTAYARAQAAAAERTNPRSTELPRSKSNASRNSQGSFLQREASLRSMPRKPGQILDVPRKSRASTMATEKFPPFHVTPGTDKTTSSHPSVSSNENARPSSQPKPQRSSATSSMASQQVRKARSMYYASTNQTGSPIPRPPAKYLATPPPVSPVPDSSFLSARGTEGSFQRPRSSAVSPLASPRLPVTVEPNETVNTARDKYLQDFQQHEQRQVKHKPSLFLAPFKKRQDKGKKKAPSSTSRGVSNDSHAPTDPDLDVSLVEFKPVKEKRSISDSLRNRFKKVFRRTSGKATTGTLPVQQINARRDYYDERTDHPHLAISMQSRLDIPSPDEDTLQRIASRSPSLEGGYPALARPSSRGSNRSLHSEVSMCNTTKSRVTSWADSSYADDTLTQRAIKRLTVIHEAKDSISSDAAASPIRKPPPLPGFAAFRDPMPMDSLTEEAMTPIDPKRVFSALMKEIDASKTTQGHVAPVQHSPGGDSDVFVSSATRELHSSASRETRAGSSRDYRASASSDAQTPLTYLRPESVSAQNKTGSVTSNSFKSFGRAIKATIRTVTPSGHPGPSSSPGPDSTTSVRGAVRMPRPHSAGSSTSTISEEAGSPNNTRGSINFRKRTRVHAPGHLQRGTVVTPTHNQSQSRVQKTPDRWMTPLEVNNAPVTPDSTSRTIKVTYNAETENQRVLEERQELKHHAYPKSPKPTQVFSPLSPSVYSRNTDGMSILPNDSVMSLDGAVEGGVGTESASGSAVIITSHSVKSYRIGTPSPRRVTSSARSSRDWKAWLSHEVSELGNLPTDDIAISDQYTTPTGHRREFTQISEEDTTVIVHELEGSPVSEQESIKTETRTPTKREDSVEPSTSRKVSPDSLPPLKSCKDSQTSPKLPPRPSSSPMPKQRRLSSIPSSCSSLTRPKLEQRSSSRMNDRFPFIETKRRSSSNSARLTRHTPSLGSGSSSSKATPSPKVYSDFSAPSSNRTSKDGGDKPRSKRSQALDSGKENQKQNVTPPITKQLLGVGSTHSLDRPKSLQPLNNSAWNRGPSSLAQYTTSADDTKSTQPSADAAAPSPRIRVRMRPISPGKLTTRPKSAFDLRGMNTSTPNLAAPAPTTRPGSESPRKNDRYVPERKPVTSRALEGDTLRSVLESSMDLANLSNRTPSPRSSPRTSTVGLKRSLLVKSSSSTLALNKEPSPGKVSPIIDSVLSDEEEDERFGSRGGSVTPGQRMAERFLRERGARSGAGSPAGVEGCQRSEAPSPALSPAFI